MFVFVSLKMLILTMLVFIDDSGDPGFKFNNGSSSHFVIACIIFEDNLDAEETALKIKRYRRTLGWRDEHEFKFNKTSQKIRIGFLNEIKSCNFTIRAIVCDKTHIRSPELIRNKNKFYNYMIKQVLDKSTNIQNASLRMDGHGDRSYKKAANTYFRQQLNKNRNLVNKLKFVNSKNGSLIQLADMVAGSIYKTTQKDKTDKDLYKNILMPRINDIWNFR